MSFVEPPSALMPSRWDGNEMSLRQTPESTMDYNARVSRLRKHEYPALEGTTYLDHAGTTLYARSLIEAFSHDMLTNLLGNPHSTSTASQRTALRIDNVRLQALRLFKADPANFDIVFVANATAGIKLVAEAFAGHEGGFWYGYHRDAHTSMVGVREHASEGSKCFTTDREVESWLEGGARAEGHRLCLFAYPAQSNMNGRRLPLDWCRRLRRLEDLPCFSLLDAAALVSTAPLDLSDEERAPDFTVLSFYKMYGFPDLGALIVRKAASPIFDHRLYFGGGTVDVVTCFNEQWHMKKEGPLHERLEDGTLPIHSILALGSAIRIHEQLFGSVERISSHAGFLAQSAYDRLSSLRHGNGRPVCTVYQDASSSYDDLESQGPVIAFNIQDCYGKWASNHEVQKVAAIQKVELRSGTLCNPAGMAYHLNLEPQDLRRFYKAGYRCDNESDVQDGKPIGMIRVSFGAMSTLDDVDSLLHFLEYYFVDTSSIPESVTNVSTSSSDLFVQSLSIYPIKSCGAWDIPRDLTWPIRKEGLAWDREWCLVHQGTYAALSQKRFPRMSLLKPSLDLAASCLLVQYMDEPSSTVRPFELRIPLSLDPSLFREPASDPTNDALACLVGLCGDRIQPLIYASPHIHAFFSNHLGIPVYLARLPAGSTAAAASRISKLRPRTVVQRPTSPPSPTDPVPGSFPSHQSPPSPPPSPPSSPAQPLLGSNESPILVVSSASVARLNSAITAAGDAPVPTAVFRANVVLGPRLRPSNDAEDHAARDDDLGTPFAEDTWRRLAVVSTVSGADTPLDILGPCRRCQVVCVDPATGTRRKQPFTALARMRKRDGGVWFGVHAGLAPQPKYEEVADPTIGVGDLVRVHG